MIAYCIHSSLISMFIVLLRFWHSWEAGLTDSRSEAEHTDHGIVLYMTDGLKLRGICNEHGRHVLPALQL